MPNDFPDQLAELLAYLGDGLPEDHPFAPLHAAMPRGGDGPDVWMLGSSLDSAAWAAAHGLPYCFADFINDGGAAHAAAYRRDFRPSARLAAPHVAVAAWTIAAETRAEAERLAAPARMMFAHLVSGRPIAVPTAAEAVAWLDANPAFARHRRRTILGSPGEVRAGLDMLAAEYGADELMLVNILPDHAARRLSYALVAREYGLASLPRAA